jgi:CRISPR/Cas system-associated exonuclease Cas4 (RecB family)
MTPFLKEIARYLYSTCGEELTDCCLVFPNQRAGLFLKKYLSELVPKPIWSPQILTISDLMSELSDLSEADDLFMLFELYDVYCSEKKTKESFDSFYFWGEILLSDFDDIDKYLVNAADLFRNVAALKSIEEEFSYLSEDQVRIIQRFWQSFTPEIPGQHKEEFLNTWEILHRIYAGLKDRLAAKKLGYEGMVYRRVTELIDNDNLPSLSFTRIFFIGFNALNECEKKLFRHFQKQGKAFFFWDYDDYYVQNRNHEAGRFIRKNIMEFGMVDCNISHNNLLNDKDIQIISVPSEVGQARILPHVLSGFNDTSPETAIIPANENLLLPVMHSLPESISEYNITMGYPVQETQLYSLISHVIRLQENTRQNEESTWKFYSQDVLAILSHPSVNHGYETEFRKLAEVITNQNLIFVNESLLQGHPVLNSLFIHVKDQGEMLTYLLNILEEIARRSAGQDPMSQGQDGQMKALENEILFQLFIRIKRLDEILRGRKVEFQTSTLYRLVRKILMNTHIPFSGEPLTGLQVMGVLETRVLDFRNIVLLSMNEGIFPKTPVRNSFIPHNLRYGFNLPTLEHHDAIYSYYFYRLIQRAEKVVLIYNSKSEGLSGGEKSRFLHQLIFSKLFSVREKVIAYNIQPNPERPVSVMKDGRVMERLREFTDGAPGGKYLSPTALNMYLDCSLKFYFNFIAGLEEPEELKEEIDTLLFGNLLHTAVKSLYEQFGSEMISKEMLNGLLLNSERIDFSVKSAFKEVYKFSGDPGKMKIEGKNVIIRGILEKYLTAIIERDISYTPFRIAGMEKKIKIILPVNTETGRFEVVIGGKIDRIDYTANEIRILDYKTGRITPKVNNISDLFDRNQENRNSAVFQVLLYARLIQSSMQELTASIVPGLYPIMDISQDNFDYHIYTGPPHKKEILGDYRIINDEFSDKLTEVVGEIFNPAAPFYPTEITDRCQYCPYRNICHR